jgi:hypothetical protein
MGHFPAASIAGSHRKAVAPNPKSNGKRKLANTSDLDSSDSGGESEPAKGKSTHGGRRNGAGNYKDEDLRELLRLVEEELPIGAHGWKRVHARYAQWASRHGRPPHDPKAVENKFKMVHCTFPSFILANAVNHSSRR